MTRQPTQLVAGNGTLYSLADDGSSWIMVWTWNVEKTVGRWEWQRMMDLPDGEDQPEPALSGGSDQPAGTPSHAEPVEE